MVILSSATVQRQIIRAVSSQSTTIEIGDQDDDLDGLTDEEEEEYATDPNNPDSDGDGLLDGEEVYQYETQPDNPDSDGDGLLDGEDILCDPHISDVDEDGISDWKEGTSDLDGDGIINAWMMIQMEMVM